MEKITITNSTGEELKVPVFNSGVNVKLEDGDELILTSKSSEDTSFMKDVAEGFNVKFNSEVIEEDEFGKDPIEVEFTNGEGLFFGEFYTLDGECLYEYQPFHSAITINPGYYYYRSSDYKEFTKIKLTKSGEFNTSEIDETAESNDGLPAFKISILGTPPNNPTRTDIECSIYDEDNTLIATQVIVADCIYYRDENGDYDDPYFYGEEIHLNSGGFFKSKYLKNVSIGGFKLGNYKVTATFQDKSATVNVSTDDTGICRIDI